MGQAIIEDLKCSHCAQEVIRPVYQDNNPEDTVFCCHGCKTVYNFLHSQNLQSYYSIHEGLKKGQPLNTPELSDQSQSDYSYLDEEEFINDHATISTSGSRSMDFYVKGIECLACVWILEKIPQIYEDAITVNVDLNTSIAKINIKKNGKFAKVAELIKNFGYLPQPLESNEEWLDLQKKENRERLLRIGVAAASAGNAMIFSVPLYAGMEGEFKSYFEFIVGAASLPALTYSALPLYQSALRSLRSFKISIDLPIALAIILGFSFSVYNLTNGSDHYYFDSLSALVFLILGSRQFQKTMQSRAESVNRLIRYNQSGVVQRYSKSKNGFISVDKKYLKAGDLIKVAPQSIVPADGKIESDNYAYLNTSVLTGESYPQKFKKSQTIYSGFINSGSDFLMRVEFTAEETRLGSIIKKASENSVQNSLVNRADKIAHYFLISVLLSASAVFLYHFLNNSTQLGIESALSMIIIACPCALGLATPLAMTRSLAISLKNKIFIKDGDVFEKIVNSDKAFFDKTGTLTSEQVEVSHVKLESEEPQHVLSLILSLEKDSSHPLAKVIKEYCLINGAGELLVEDVKEIPGLGMEGQFNNQALFIGKNEIGECIFKKDNKILATFEFNDRLLNNAKDLKSFMKSKKKEMFVISGDNHKKVSRLASLLDLNSDHAFAELSPEDKAGFIERNPNSIMVGDGVNDSLSMKQADVSIAVSGGVESSLKICDVYLSTKGLKSLYDLFTISDETIKVIRRNLIISIIFNSVGLGLASMGMISPLVAAFFMPISSLSVLFSTVWGTKKLRRFN